MQTITVPRTHRPQEAGAYCWCGGILLTLPNGQIEPHHNDAVGAVFRTLPSPWIIWQAKAPV